MTALVEPICELYDPDTVFEHFRVVEFPMSIVGLSTSQKLDLTVDFNKSAYLRTVCEGKLMVSLRYDACCIILISTWYYDHR